MSPREQAQQQLVTFLRSSGRWTAPYGIIEGFEDMPNGGKLRCVTFGVARVSDIHVTIANQHKITMRDSRYGRTTHSSIDSVIRDLRINYAV